MRAFVLYVSEEVILSFKVIRLAEVAVMIRVILGRVRLTS